MRTLHLFAGLGGGVYADLILGHSPTYAVELDPWRCERLGLEFPQLTVIQEDIRNVRPEQFAGEVDLVHAGIPCPRWSQARHQVGDPEDLIDATVSLATGCGAEWIFFECVSGFLREHERLGAALAGRGYTLARPLVFPASAVGAPFTRRRYWALARADKEGQPYCPVHGQVAELSAPHPSPWDEADPSYLQVDDGVAGRTLELQAVGDGQVPLQAATAYVILGGPYALNV